MWIFLNAFVVDIAAVIFIVLTYRPILRIQVIICIREVHDLFLVVLLGNVSLNRRFGKRWDLSFGQDAFNFLRCGFENVFQ